MCSELNCDIEIRLRGRTCRGIGSQLAWLAVAEMSGVRWLMSVYGVNYVMVYTALTCHVMIIQFFNCHTLSYR